MALNQKWFRAIFIIEKHMKDTQERYTQEQIEEALRAADGLASDAADLLKCTPETVRKYISKYPYLQRVLYEITEDMNDTAERNVYHGLRSGSDKYTQFYLRTKGKSRGYTTGQEHSGPGGGPIQYTPILDVKNLSSKRLQPIVKLLEAFRKRTGRARQT